MQHECDALRGRKRFEHDQHRQADRIGQQNLVFRVVAGDVMQRQRLFPPRFARTKHVQAYACYDGGQPAGEVVDASCVRAAQPDPCLLHRVVGLVGRAQHAVRHGPQVGAMRLETLGQILVLSHRPSDG